MGNLAQPGPNWSRQSTAVCPWAGALLHAQHPEAGQAEHHLGNASSVTHRQEPPRRRSRDEANDAGGPPDPRSAPTRYPLATLGSEEPPKASLPGIDGEA